VNRFAPNEVVVLLATGRQQALPAWMLDEQFCQSIRDEPVARIDFAALRSLRSLLDAQPLLSRDGVASAAEPQTQGGSDAVQAKRSEVAALFQTNNAGGDLPGDRAALPGIAQPDASADCN
jgi:hypothetical protein